MCVLWWWQNWNYVPLMAICSVSTGLVLPMDDSDVPGGQAESGVEWTGAHSSHVGMLGRWNTIHCSADVWKEANGFHLIVSVSRRQHTQPVLCEIPLFLVHRCCCCWYYSLASNGISNVHSALRNHFTANINHNNMANGIVIVNDGEVITVYSSSIHRYVAEASAFAWKE